MKNLFNVIGGGLIYICTYFLGGFDLALQSLLIVIVLDYVTGLFKAIYNKNVSSEIGLKGIVKKIFYLVLVALVCILDKILGDSGNIRLLCIYFFISNEGISILENAASMNVPFPKKIKELLIQLQEKE